MIEITETDKAYNLAFQIKTLLQGLETQTKPELVKAVTFMENGAEGLSKEAISSAFGTNSQEILNKLKALVAAI